MDALYDSPCIVLVPQYNKIHHKSPTKIRLYKNNRDLKIILIFFVLNWFQLNIISIQIHEWIIDDHSLAMGLQQSQIIYSAPFKLIKNAKSGNILNIELGRYEEASTYCVHFSFHWPCFLTSGDKDVFYSVHSPLSSLCFTFTDRIFQFKFLYH